MGIEVRNLGSEAALCTVRYLNVEYAYYFHANIDNEQNIAGHQRLRGVPIRAVRDP